MKKNIVIFLGSLALFLAAKPFKDKNLNPAVNEPKMPGTTQEIEKVNPSPNPTAGENESDAFGGSIIKLKKSKFDEESEKTNKEKRKSL